jgi:L-asparaginase II
MLPLFLKRRIKMGNPIQIIFNRNEKPECVHLAHAALCDVQGQLIKGWGDPYYETYWRSAAKPFQTLALLMNDKCKKWDFTNTELAVMASSHNGEEQHIKAVQSILKKIDCSENLLECGVMVPIYVEVVSGVNEPLATYSSIQHMCSGKHAMMLALAKALGVPTKNYKDVNHPVQIAIKNEIARSIDFPVDYISEGVDGCGTPVFWIDLTAMARAYAKIAAPEKAYLAPEFEAALRTIETAMTTEPFMVAGTNRIETDLMEKSEGNLLAKSGADGVFCVANLAKGEGLSLKIADGGLQAVGPAVLTLLAELQWIHNDLYSELWTKYAPNQLNYSGQPVGTISVIL